jgi:hypothetical protein
LLLAAMPLDPLAGSIGAVAFVLAMGTRFLAAIRFRASLLGAAFHPLGIVVLLGIQWYALVRSFLGRPVGWKGRPVDPLGSVAVTPLRP